MSRKYRAQNRLAQAVVRYMRAENMVQPGEKILCALSGGCDSVAMLLLLRKIAGMLQISLSAAHVNHGLRGAEARRDEAFCQSLCQRLAVPFTSLRGDALALAKTEGKGIEAAARTLRYGLLQSEAAAQNALLATAHTASDNLETVLINLLRGSGTAGLAGIPPKRERIIRPILCLSRRDTMEAAEAFEEEYVTDSTNINGDFLRNRLRKTVVPALCALSPSILETTLRSGQALRMDAAYLDGLAREQNPFANGKAAKKAAAALPKPQALRILSKEAAACGAELSLRQALSLWRLLQSEKGGRISLQNGVVFRCKGKEAFFTVKSHEKFSK